MISFQCVILLVDLSFFDTFDRLYSRAHHIVIKFIQIITTQSGYLTGSF